ncbi:hypothetical protein H1D31_03120 [Alishewanella sp. BS5-314]|uniref:hypothetical protein n=1 Tax=Alishewanella sp. BS5-314 TaxID=2755587 RepID=UPI0021BAE9B7|nr:hypothetical protein [Alishewanella sp. BS5-314]MCT8125032.1 hypothetical protein [Alishewanella sp. BS5-314]
MNIDANNSLQLSAVNKVSHEQQPVVPPQQDAVKRVTDKAESSQVSASSQQLQQSFSNLANTSDVDLDKVSLIQKALAEDKLALQDEQLIESMLDMHKNVLDLFKR